MTYYSFKIIVSKWVAVIGLGRYPNISEYVLSSIV
jgi:hypothetical protein